MSQLFRLPSSVKRDPAIDIWMKEHTGELGQIAKHWFGIMRTVGDDVREVLHDGHPTACVADAAFATHAVGWPSCNTSRTSSPTVRMIPNQCFAIWPSSPVCSFIQISMAGSRLTELGSRKSWL